MQEKQIKDAATANDNENGEELQQSEPQQSPPIVLTIVLLVITILALIAFWLACAP